MHFCQKKEEHFHPELFLNCTALPVVEETKFLGLIFASKLTLFPTWNIYIGNVYRLSTSFELSEHGEHGGKSVQLPHLGAATYSSSVDWEYCAHTSMQYCDVKTRLQPCSSTRRATEICRIVTTSLEHSCSGGATKTEDCSCDSTPEIASLASCRPADTVQAGPDVLQSQGLENAGLSSQVVIRSNYLFVSVIEVFIKNITVSNAHQDKLWWLGFQCFGARYLEWTTC